MYLRTGSDLCLRRSQEEAVDRHGRRVVGILDISVIVARAGCPRNA